jgi:DNA-binding NarL/FixJ family response regulator
VTKVLVVSESPIVRVGIREILKDAQDVQIVGEAPTMDDLSRVATARSANLLLLSPLTTVAETLERLRRVRTELTKLAVMLIVREANPYEVSEALRLGCLGYLTLDLTKNALVHAVRRIARGQRVVEPALLDRVLTNLARQPAAPKGVLGTPERQVLRLLSEGHTNREIARRLGYSLSTVKDYVQKILQKLEAPNRTQAAVKAMRLGF